MRDDQRCQWCGQTHGIRCPELRAIEYYENGSIKRVEYLTPADMKPPRVEYSAPSPRPRELTEAEKEKIARDYRRIRM